MRAKEKPVAIGPERIEAYRDFRPMELAAFVKVLESFDAHRRMFGEIGREDLVAAAERAWVQDSINVAAIPAGSLSEAEDKIGYLRSTIDGWVIASPRAAEHLACVSMVLAALEVEAARWGLRVASERKTH
jgi:hypothetical protein